MASTKCEYEFTVSGPHDGCAEFAEPDVFICGKPGTVMDSWHEESFGSTGRYAIVLCEEHEAAFAPKTIPGVVIVSDVQRVVLQ